MEYKFISGSVCGAGARGRTSDHRVPGRCGHLPGGSRPRRGGSGVRRQVVVAMGSMAGGRVSMVGMASAFLLRVH
jgi:hypothetical protein